MNNLSEAFVCSVITHFTSTMFGLLKFLLLGNYFWLFYWFSNFLSYKWLIVFFSIKWLNRLGKFSINLTTTNYYFFSLIFLWIIIVFLRTLNSLIIFFKDKLSDFIDWDLFCSAKTFFVCLFVGWFLFFVFCCFFFFCEQKQYYYHKLGIDL